MSRNTMERGLKVLAAVASRASAVGLVVLGLAPPAAAQQLQPAGRSVGERIERVRSALHERGPGALGPMASALGATEQDPPPAPEPEPNPPDWNDWNDWADY